MRMFNVHQLSSLSSSSSSSHALRRGVRAQIERVEPRTLLSTTLVNEYAGGFSVEPFAGNDALYASGWSTDGSLAGARGAVDLKHLLSFRPWHGGAYAFDGGPAGGFGSGNGSLFAGGRETGLKPIEFGPDVKNFIFDGSVTIGRYSYAPGDKALMKFDGSPLNAVDIKSFDAFIDHLTRIGTSDRFCFTVAGDVWVSDGTTSGTTLLTGGSIRSMTSAGDYVYFDKEDASKGRELWRTDGTSAGTTRVVDITPGAAGSETYIYGALDNVVYFATEGPSSAFMHLWRSDGTEAGTQKLLDLPKSAILGAMQYAGGKMYFAVDQLGRDPDELWVTDSTLQGTHRVADLSSGVITIATGNTRTVFNGRQYFIASTDASSHQLWSTDGTSAGTRREQELSTLLSSRSTQFSLTPFNGALYFAFDDNQRVSRVYRFSDSSISISGETFNDADADGAIDPAEKRLAGVRVYLDANNDKTFDAGERSAITDARGRYAFGGLSAGTYRVRQVTPSGMRQTSPAYTLPLVAGDHVIKTIGSAASGAAISGTISGEHGGLGGFIVFADLNANGRREKTEPATVTDDVGHYALLGLSPAIYTVRVQAQDGWFSTGNPAARVRVKSNATSQLNFAQHVAATLKFRTYDDRDLNTKQDAGEPNLSDPRTEFKFFKDGQTRAIPTPSVRIDTGGRFVVRLEPGKYTMAPLFSPGWRQSFQRGGVASVTSVDAKAGEITSRSLSMTNTAAVVPQYFRDVDGDGKFEVEDSLLDTNKYHYTFQIDKDRDGAFDFGDAAGLTPGTYRVKLIEFVEDDKVTSPTIQSIKVRAGEVGRVYFGIA